MFRNNNGISMKLVDIDCLFSKRKSGFKNYSKLECKLVDLYFNDQNKFDVLLLETREEYNINGNIQNK